MADSVSRQDGATRLVAAVTKEPYGAYAECRYLSNSAYAEFGHLPSCRH